MARPIAKNYDEKRQLILRQAAVVFAKHGYDGATMAQLAEACGISKGNIYHYYSGKSALLFGILDGYLCQLRDRICGLDIASLPLKHQFEALVLETLLAYDGADYEHRIQSKGFAMLPAAQQSRLKAYQRDIVGRFSTVLLALAPQVFEGNRPKLRATTMSVFGMLNWFYMWNTESGCAARITYAKIVSTLTLHGVNGFE